MFCKYVTYGWGSSKTSSRHAISVEGSGMGKALGAGIKSCSASPGRGGLFMGKGRGLRDVVNHDTEYGSATTQEVKTTDYLDRWMEEQEEGK